MGLVAHPANIGNIHFSYDGQYLITSGTTDMAINLWNVNTDAIDSAVEKSGTGEDAFNKMVDGGADGEFYNNMVDYFYYSQLRAQVRFLFCPSFHVLLYLTYYMYYYLTCIIITCIIIFDILHVLLLHVLLYLTYYMYYII